MSSSLHVKYPLFLSGFNETVFYRKFFEKKIQITIFMKNPSSGSRVVPCGQRETDGRTDEGMDMTKPPVTIRNFANAPYS